MKSVLPFPEQGDFPAYYLNYFKLLDTEKDLLQIMHEDALYLKSLIEQIPDEKFHFAYDDGKWTAAQLIQHITDTERIMTYRALCIARGDQTSLPGFDENFYAKNASVNHKSREMFSLEWFSVRQATLSFYLSLSPNEYLRTGISNQNKVSVTALAHVTIGHARHHIQVLKDRYLMP